jgi:hypothetical protein
MLHKEEGATSLVSCFFKKYNHARRKVKVP